MSPCPASSSGVTFFTIGAGGSWPSSKLATVASTSAFFSFSLSAITWVLRASSSCFALSRFARSFSGADNRGQTTVYLIQQTIPPFLASPLDVAFPTFRARHAAPMPLIPAPRTPHFQAHNFRSSHAGFHRPGPAPVRIETVHDTPLRGSPHPYPVQGTTNAASAANQARLVRCSDNSTSDIPPGARPCPPARDSIRCTADTPADSFLPG